MRRCRKNNEIFLHLFSIELFVYILFREKIIKKIDNIHAFHTIIILSDNIKKKLVDKRI